MTRITYGMTNNHIQTGLAKNYKQLDHIMNQVSSQKRIQTPSDDSVGTWQALRLRSDIGSNTQYKRNIDDGIGWLSVTDSALSSGNEVYQTIRELTLEAASDTYGPSERKAIMLQTRQLMEQIVTLANTNYNGSYIFSGTQTQQAPYSVQMDGKAEVTLLGGAAIALTDLNAVDSLGNHPVVKNLIPGSVSIPGMTEGTDYDVDYVAGTIAMRPRALPLESESATTVRFDWVKRSDLDLSGQVLREAQQGVEIPVNVQADDVFGQANRPDSFSAIIRVMEGMHLNQSEKIRGSVDGLDQARNRFIHSQTIAGSLQNRMDLTTATLTSNNLELMKRQSAVEDIDLVQAASELSQRQQVYEASLQVAAKIIQPTLMQFL
jgi:flagellar hook-associated protein 3 FlgL